MEFGQRIKVGKGEKLDHLILHDCKPIGPLDHDILEKQGSSDKVNSQMGMIVVKSDKSVEEKDKMKL